MQSTVKDKEWHKTFNALRNRNFLLYWIGEFAYYGGLRMSNVAQSWLVYEMTGSAFLLGLVAASHGLPRFILSLLGGVIADRIKKKKLLLFMQVGLGFNAFILAILLSMGVGEYWHIAVLALFDGIFISFALPARLAFVSEIVSKEEFLNAYALYYVALNLMSTVGPGLAGILVAYMGVNEIFYIIGTCHFILATILLRIRISETVIPHPNFSLKKDISEILNFARQTPIILTLMGMQVALTFLVTPAQTLMPVFAVDILNVGSIGLGILGAATGIGALIGSLYITSLGNFKRKTLLLLSSGIVRGFSLILFASSRIFYLSLFFNALGGFFNAIYITLNSSLYQLNATEKMRGRVMSLYMMAWGLQPIAVLPMTMISESISAPLAVIVGGTLFAAFCTTISILLPNFRQISK